MIAIIPAKLTSSRIKRKNLQKINGRSLVEYAIDCAVEAGCFDEIIVSSEDTYIIEKTIKIANIIYEKSNGSQNDCSVYVIRREDELSGKNATVADVCTDLLNQNLHIWDKQPESFCVLLPTSPLRTSQNILMARSIFDAHRANCVMSVSEYKYHPEQALLYCGYLEGVHVYEAKDMEGGIIGTKDRAYHHDGNIIICKTDEFLKQKDFYGIPNTKPYFTPEENAIDINTPLDLKIARLLMGDKDA